MASVTARILFTCVVVAATAAASGAPPREHSEARVPASAAPLLLATAGDTANAGTNHRGKELLLASAMAPTGMAASGALHRQELKPQATEFEVKEWMLIAMGFFLICAMSHRRSQSMGD